MRKYKIHHVDSFTNQLFGGNPTVAILGADSLTELEMKQIAREMNMCESGFVLSSNQADIRLRFFSPIGCEIKFCGHATVGALRAIAIEGLYGCTKTINRMTIETNAGILNVEIDLSNANTPLFIFDAPKIELVQAPFTVEEVAKGLHIDVDLFDTSKPVMIEKTNNYLYLTARNLGCLRRISPEMEPSLQFAKKAKVGLFCVFTNEAFDRENQFHARAFVGPLIGVPEDPFTGSMQGGLAAYAISQGLTPPVKWIGVEQGHFIDRPGSVKLEIMQLNPIHVRLHAQAIHVFKAELVLPGD